MKTASFKSSVRKPEKSPDPDLLEFIASSDRVDRMGDVVAQNWDLRGIRSNPVFLWSHNGRDLPIGRITKIWTEKTDAGKQTRIQVKFVPPEIWDFPGRVKAMYEAEFLNAVSIGFRPLEVREMSQEDKTAAGMEPYGLWFEKSELLEVSAVSVPANPDAVQVAVSRGMPEQDIKDFADSSPLPPSWALLQKSIDAMPACEIDGEPEPEFTTATLKTPEERAAIAKTMVESITETLKALVPVLQDVGLTITQLLATDPSVTRNVQDPPVQPPEPEDSKDIEDDIGLDDEDDEDWTEEDEDSIDETALDEALSEIHEAHAGLAGKS